MATAVNQNEQSKHIDELAGRHCITVRKEVSKAGNRSPRGYSERRLILTWGINSDIEYFVALHEMGHVVNCDGLKSRADTLFYEAEAWEWAIKNAKWPPHGGVKILIGDSLKSYERWAEGKKGIKVPPKGHCWHKYVGWARLRPQPIRYKRRLP